MKKLLFFAICALSAFMVNAKGEDNPENYKVRVTKTDGTVFEGYNETAFRNYFRPKVKTVSISDEYKGKAVKYKSSEIKRLVFVVSMNDSLPYMFDAVKASITLPSLFNKNPKPTKEPIMLQVIYTGENVTGYIMPCTDITNTPGMKKIVRTWKYLYKTKDSDVAKAYWLDTSDIIVGMKSVMKLYFREFPEIVKMVEEKELTPKEFRENPAKILQLMDKTYQPNTNE